MCRVCSGLLGSCSPVCSFRALCCVCGVLGHLVPVQRCARAMCCAVCALSLSTGLLFTSVPSRCVVFRVWCPGQPSPCTPVCLLGVLCCVCGVLGHLAPVLRCARSVRCVVCAVSWATWLLLSGVLARCVVLRVWCPESLGSCSPKRRAHRVLCCVCGVLAHLALLLRCACSVRCVVCAASLTPWLLFTDVSAQCAVCAVSLATRPLSTGAPARCVILRVRCRPGPFGSSSHLRPFRVLYCVCGVLGYLAPVLRCASSVRFVACAGSWATWLLLTGVLARCVVFRVRCYGQLSSCSPVCSLGALCCVCGGQGHLPPVHRCACAVCCAACEVCLATWLLFTGVPARCAVCGVSLATWLLVTGVHARCAACAVSWAT